MPRAYASCSYGGIDPIERTVYVNDPNNIAGMGALLDAIIAWRP